MDNYLNLAQNTFAHTCTRAHIHDLVRCSSCGKFYHLINLPFSHAAFFPRFRFTLYICTKGDIHQILFVADAWIAFDITIHHIIWRICVSMNVDAWKWLCDQGTFEHLNAYYAHIWERLSVWTVNTVCITSWNETPHIYNVQATPCIFTLTLSLRLN